MFLHQTSVVIDVPLSPYLALRILWLNHSLHVMILNHYCTRQSYTQNRPHIGSSPAMLHLMYVHPSLPFTVTPIVPVAITMIYDVLNGTEPENDLIINRNVTGSKG